MNYFIKDPNLNSFFFFGGGGGGGGGGGASVSKLF